jgi:4-amino-4-deoxy-L-arabinose transferase-like glycosyltransferase
VRRIWRFAPSAAVGLALALRLYRLDWQSLWYDEIFAVTVSHLSWPAMHAELIKDVVHPPLHYYLLHIWMGLFGLGPMQARLLSVLFGALSVAVIYKLAEYLFDRQTAILSALFLGVSQTGIHYSQEARPYAQFLFLTLCSAVLFVQALHNRRAATWWLFVASAVALLYTHYYSVFVFAVSLIFGFASRKRHPISAARWIGALAVLAAALGVWMASGALREALGSNKVSLGASSEHWYTALTVLNIFNNGRSNGFAEAAPLWSFPIGLAVFSVPALIAIIRALREPAGKDRENTLFLVLLCSVPLALALGIGLLIPFFDIRYVGFCAAPYYILVARGLASIPSRALYASALSAGLVFSIYGLRANYFLPYKEDHRDALTDIAARAKPGDCYVAVPPWEERQVRWAWAIYNRNSPELATIPYTDIPSSGCGRVWLIAVSYMNQPLSVQRAREAKALLANDYSEAGKRTFFWMETGLYERKRGEASQR